MTKSLSVGVLNYEIGALDACIAYGTVIGLCIKYDLASANSVIAAGASILAFEYGIMTAWQVYDELSDRRAGGET
jgi:hypothetical protein